ncbi:MAG: cbb3-type cytochrome oxidase cytochrome c subunit, partial [Lysobacterales bacterium]
MSKQPESHYNIDKLHFVFAIGALALLTVIGAVFMNDYDRKWKDYQNKFAQYKVEIARTKFDAEDKKLTNNAEYQNLVKEVEAARESYETTCLDTEELDTEINDLKTEKILTEQELRHTNAVRDAARFKYENAVGHHTEGIADLKTTYTELNTKAQELNLKAEEATVALNKKTETKLTCGAALKELQDKKRTIASKHTMMKKNLQATDPNEMTLLNRFAQVVRNLPILDLSTPTTKVKQIVLKDITEDLIIRQAPKVDRCMTCHLGIDNPDFADFPQPYRTHPNLDQYISNDSAHPIEEFGCTVCHGGKGRATGFQSAVHTPQNAEQQKDWEEKYNWKQDHHWEQPMLPLQHAQAGCFKCHSGENPIKGAETLNLGLKIIEKAGCYACHEIDRYKDWQNPGPDLTKISSKLSKEFAYKWIEDPHFFKKDTWMPAYFNLANNSDLVSQARSQQEIHAMVNYLFAESKDYKLNKMPKIFDAKNGEELVASLGCMACHNTEVLPESHETTTDSLRSQHGPSLTDLGTKTSKEWIYNWLKDPARYHAETRMPSLRLSDQEAADVAGYLVEDKHKTFVMKSIPGFDEDILNDIALGFMVKQQPKKQADRKLAKMTLDEKMYFSGEKLISQYGCYSCHNISGFENAKPIGVALNEEGSKSLHKFDFGYVHVD